MVEFNKKQGLLSKGIKRARFYLDEEERGKLKPYSQKQGGDQFTGDHCTSKKGRT